MGACHSSGNIKASGVTSSQGEALEYYASGDGMYINNMLRGRAGVNESDLSEDDRQIIKDLDAALNHELSQQTLYRSVDASAIFGDSVDMYELLDEIKHNTYSNGKGAYSQNKAKELNQVINNTVGKTFTDKGYVSTTRDSSIAENWQDFTGSSNPVVMKISTGEGTKGANISKATKYLSELERENPQKETLLGRNQKYKINKIYAKNNMVYIDVKM